MFGFTFILYAAFPVCLVAALVIWFQNPDISIWYENNQTLGICIIVLGLGSLFTWVPIMSHWIPILIKTKFTTRRVR